MSNVLGCQVNALAQAFEEMVGVSEARKSLSSNSSINN